ncbi:MAG: FAD:protein FMN transferase [Candidatus Sedimenticola sp. 20ELBAFRAG]
MKVTRGFRFSRALWLCLLLLVLAGCERPPQVENTRFLAFGTLVDLTIAGASRDDAEKAAEILEQDFLQMHRAWHAWDPGPLGRINRLIREGETSFSAPPSLIRLIQLGSELSIQSDRLFNPSIGNLVDAWGFHSNDPEGHRPPKQQRIDELLSHNPQMSDLSLQGIELKSTNPAVKLDFGAFGKGYGIDLAIEHLKELGIDHAIINAGGDLRAIGSKNGQPWRIGIRHPSGTGVLATLDVEGDESVFTSGDYERNFEWQGQRYHHIIDPRTGYPASGTRSITVLHSKAVTADAAATALFIAGPGGWQKIARQMSIDHVLLVDDRGNLHMTPPMQKRLQFLESTGNIMVSPPLSDNKRLSTPAN